MDETTKQPRAIEDLPVEGEQAAEVKGGVVPDGPELTKTAKALNFTLPAPTLLK
jgi:hypothetical protein